MKMAMVLRAAVSSKIPMVIIVGATGTGKTKLGVELAQKYDTEVISADSMQIYKGLDIVTAKASAQERAMATHHLLDILEPHQTFTVVDFRSRALKIIDNLTEQGKIPVIVGGTNYYIESIVYKILVDDSDDPEVLLYEKGKRKIEFGDNEGTSVEERNKRLAVESQRDDKEISEKSNATKTESTIDTECEVTSEMSKEKLKEMLDNCDKFTKEDIHQALKSVDPVMAGRLHPNNLRKVLRSIEVFLKSGRRHSEILDEQKLSEGELRRPGATILFWLKCEQTIHDQRLDARVDSMLEEGLIEELLDFHARHNKQRIKDGIPPSYTKGIFQTLGFKEFHEYLMLPEEQRSSEEGKKLLQQSIENMKIGTRRYARRQNKMVRGRFLEHPNRQIPPIYELDTSDLSKWDEQVKNKAIRIIESFLNDSPCEYEPLKGNLDDTTRELDTKSSNYCEICDRLIIGDREYAIHLKSNKHMKVVKRKKRIEAQQSENEKLQVEK